MKKAEAPLDQMAEVDEEILRQLLQAMKSNLLSQQTNKFVVYLKCVMVLKFDFADFGGFKHDSPTSLKKQQTQNFKLS